MTHWIKRLLAAGATALALGSVTMAVSSPAFAKDDAKPAVTAPAAAAASAAPSAPASPEARQQFQTKVTQLGS